MDIISNNFVKNIKNLIHSAKKISIITHYNPDGDAIGSALGLYHFLKKYEIDVKVIVPNEIPSYLKWLPNADQIIIFKNDKQKTKSILKDSELIFNLDYNTLSRIESLKEFLEKLNVTKILIDHHPSPKEKEFDLIYSKDTASSTAELIFEFIQLLKKENWIDKNIATCIFVGISTDTGSFAFNSSRPQIYEIVAKLLATGIDKEKIDAQLYDNFSEERMKLLGNCLQNMICFNDLSTAILSISKEEKERFNFQKGDSEGFVNFPLTIKNIKNSVLFIENKKFIKISFRSRYGIDTNQFARKYFNGGGHKKASGGRYFKSLEETKKDFIKYLKEFMEEK